MLFYLYDSTMQSHAPRRKLVLLKKVESPSFDLDCDVSKRATRLLERQFLRDPSNKKRKTSGVPRLKPSDAFFNTNAPRIFGQVLKMLKATDEHSGGHCTRCLIHQLTQPRLSHLTTSSTTSLSRQTQSALQPRMRYCQSSQT